MIVPQAHKAVTTDAHMCSRQITISGYQLLKRNAKPVQQTDSRNTHTHRQLTRGLYNALLDALRTVHFSHVSSL